MRQSQSVAREETPADSGRLKVAVLSNGNVVWFYKVLLTILRSRNYHTIKARDACYVLGYCDIGTLTGLGHLLSTLVKLGYADKINASQPVRYVLKPRTLWDKVREVCDLHSCEGCPLLITCPLREVTQTLSSGGAWLRNLNPNPK
jgi:hypothetical protein